MTQNSRSSVTHRSVFPLILVLLLSFPFLAWMFPPASAQEPSTAPSFEQVWPILEKECVVCHSSDFSESELVLENVEAMLTGGKLHGPALLLGNSAESPIVQYMRGGKEPQMPIGSPLSEKEIGLIAAWIDGMPTPGAQESPARDVLPAGEASGPEEDGVLSFEGDIRPLLNQYCLDCHSQQKHRSGLVLETVAGLLKGGSLEGPAILPGRSGQSPLMARLKGEKQPRMPMDQSPLLNAEIDRIGNWIDQLEMTEPVQAEAKQLAWPWKPLRRPPVPQVHNKRWGRSQVDAFVLAKLEEKGMQPAAEASSRALLRRLYFDLIGLPPTPEQMQRFLVDPSEESYRQVIEELLASPHYGERWGRHWLDLVRYSDTVRESIDYSRPHSWRYRDYVIRAFNQDRPFDRFIQEQIAGDAFPIYRTEGRLGTGFLHHWQTVVSIPLGGIQMIPALT